MKFLAARALFAVSAVLSLSSFAAAAQVETPAINSTKIIVISGPEFAAVEPTVWLEFTFPSCARMSFDLSKRDSRNGVRLTVTMPELQVDCMGPVIDHKYKIQVASSYHNETYYVANPIAPEFKSSGRDQRMCTMIAGRVVGPNGECIGFSNGCQLNDLRAQGYEFPQNGECSGN